MSHRDGLLIAFIALSVVLASLLLIILRGRRGDRTKPDRRILFPFDGRTLSINALEVAFRIAVGENAILVPTYLAVVPRCVGLDAPLPRQNDKAIALLDEIELRAARVGVTVDAQIESGRSYRHALRRAYGRQRLDRVVVAARTGSKSGFASDDVAWVLDHTDSELLVLKPSGPPPSALLPMSSQRASTLAGEAFGP